MPFDPIGIVYRHYRARNMSLPQITDRSKHPTTWNALVAWPADRR